MSHITDGLLHAHLDGAVGPERKDEWILAEAHLSVCEDCRRKLDDERRIRGVASAILESAASPIAERPGFDQLVAAAGAGRAATVPRRAWWRSTSRLAWAASLMLAVGAGWLGRELMIQTGRPLPSVVATEQQVAPATEMLDRLEADDGRGNQLDEQVSGDAVGERARDIAVAEPSAADAPVSDLQKSQAEYFRAEERQERDAGVDVDGFGDNAAAIPDEEVARRAAAPQFAEDAVGPECFAVSDAMAQNMAAVAAPERLQLLPDGIASATLDGQELQGTWTPGEADSLSVILSGAEGRLEMRLARVESGLSGGMEFAPVPAEAAAKLEGVVRADAEVQAEGESDPVRGQVGAGAAVAVVLTPITCTE